MTDAPIKNVAHNVLNQYEGLISTLEKSKDFKEIKNSNLFSIELKYATKDNFMKENAYGSFKRAFLHEIAYEKLVRAAETVQKVNPSYKLLIYDALRPRSAQRVLWKYVVGTPQQKYVADPDKGSVHNFGFAVDLTVMDENGRPLDMGAGFDDFREISQPDQEQKFVKSGELTEEHMRNRKLLRNAMVSAGYRAIAHEWWHFEALPREEVRKNHKIVE